MKTTQPWKLLWKKKTSKAYRAAITAAIAKAYPDAKDAGEFLAVTCADPLAIFLTTNAFTGFKT